MKSSNVQTRVQVFLAQGHQSNNRVTLPQAEHCFDKNKHIITIGSQPGSDIPLADPHNYVSEQHAAIIRDPGNPFSGILRDLAATNGTFVGSDRKAAQRIDQHLFQRSVHAWIGSFRLDIILTEELDPWGRVIFGDLPQPSKREAGFVTTKDPLASVIEPPPKLAQLVAAAGDASLKMILETVCEQLARQESRTTALDLLVRTVARSLGSSSIIRLKTPAGRRVVLPAEAEPIRLPKAFEKHFGTDEHVVEGGRMMVPLLDREIQSELLVGDWTFVRDSPFGPAHAEFFTDLVAWVLKICPERLASEPRAAIRARAWPVRVVGASEAFRKMMCVVGESLDPAIRVLLLGPTGVGKTFIAEEIHRLTCARSGGDPKIFQASNCANPDGVALSLELFGGHMQNYKETRIGAFERADGGAIFLDEVHALTSDMQQTLKTATSEIGSTLVSFTPMMTAQRINVQVRIISGTDRNLDHMASKGEFDPALLRRLRGKTIDVPALAERLDDVPLLATCFLDEIASKDESGAASLRLTPAAKKALMQSSWPDNVGGLKTVITNAYIKAKLRGTQGPVEDANPAEGAKGPHRMHVSITTVEALDAGTARKMFPRGFVRGVIDVDDLDLSDKFRMEQRELDAARKSAEENEIDHILSVLRQFNGDKTQALKQLRLSRTTLHQKLDNFCIPRHFGQDKPKFTPMELQEKGRMQIALEEDSELPVQGGRKPKELDTFYEAAMAKLSSSGLNFASVEAFRKRLDDLWIPRHYPSTTDQVRQGLRTKVGPRSERNVLFYREPPLAASSDKNDDKEEDRRERDPNERDPVMSP